MADNPPAFVPMDDPPEDAAMQHSPWRMEPRLSSVGDRVEAFLASAGFDRGPWLAVAFATGIALWFALPSPAYWILAISSGLLLASGSLALWRGKDQRAHLRIAGVTIGLLLASSVAVVWSKSALIGGQPIPRPLSASVEGRVLERIEQPAEDR